MPPGYALAGREQMSKKLTGSSEYGDLSATKADILDLERALYSLELARPNSETSIESAGFAPATEENLSHLEAGCFVLVQRDDVYCWAEVVSVDGKTISGRLHNELSTTTCLEEHHRLDITQFHRDQIRAMGCDRYCSC